MIYKCLAKLSHYYAPCGWDGRWPPPRGLGWAQQEAARPLRSSALLVTPSLPRTPSGARFLEYKSGQVPLSPEIIQQLPLPLGHSASRGIPGVPVPWPLPAAALPLPLRGVLGAPPRCCRFARLFPLPVACSWTTLLPSFSSRSRPRGVTVPSLRALSARLYPVTASAHSAATASDRGWPSPAQRCLPCPGAGLGTGRTLAVPRGAHRAGHAREVGGPGP